MFKQFIIIDDSTYEALLAIAKRLGLNSVEKLLTEFSKNFSSGCSVTLCGNAKVA